MRTIHMTVTLPPTTAVAVRTHRHQLDDLLRRLDIKAEQLLNAE